MKCLIKKNRRLGKSKTHVWIRLCFFCLVVFVFFRQGERSKKMFFLLLFLTLSEKGLFLLKSVFRCDCVKCGSIVELK